MARALPKKEASPPLLRRLAPVQFRLRLAAGWHGEQVANAAAAGEQRAVHLQRGGGLVERARRALRG